MNKRAAISLLNQRPRPGLAHGVQALAALLWLVQAAWIARAVGAMAAQTPNQEHQVMQAAAVVLVAGVVKAALEAWAARSIYRQARQALTALRAQVSQALCRQSPLDKCRPSSGEAASMLAEQAEAVVPWLNRYMPAQFRVMLVSPVIVLIVAWFSWTAALILLLAAPMIPLFMAVVGWQAQAASEAQMAETGRLSGFLLDRLRGLSTLRAVGAVEATAEQVLHTGLELKTRTMKVLRIAFLSSAVLELFSALGVAMVAVYVGFHLLGHLPFGAWGGKLTLAEGLFILMLAPAFFEPLRDLSAAWHDRASGLAALDNLRRLCESGIPAVGTQGGAMTVLSPAVVPQALTGMALEIENLGFAHADGSVVFDGLDLRVAAGRHVALTGGSGSGKSILLALMAGLLPAQKGRIVLDGVVLDDSSADALRSQMAWMGQKPHIFTGTVKENIFLGRPGASAPQLQQTLQATGIAAVLERLPVHILGEGGRGLSGGEAARLVLARLAAQPQARLILLDEPTAHLDMATAQQVMAAIKVLAQGRTLLVSTHDPLVLAQMDECMAVDAPASAGDQVWQAQSGGVPNLQEGQPA